MAKILLGVTGSVAAIRTVPLVESLSFKGHEVRVVATATSLYFFAAEEVPSLTLDEHEWPGRTLGQKYQRGDDVLHIALRQWADLFLIAPLDANTLAKLATGLCDNCLTSVARAWDYSKPLILAPAMNTLMWYHPVTLQNWLQLASFWRLFPDRARTESNDVQDSEAVDQVIQFINEQKRTLRIIPPIKKELACGDLGQGAMAEVATIVSFLDAWA